MRTLCLQEPAARAQPRVFHSDLTRRPTRPPARLRAGRRRAELQRAVLFHVLLTSYEMAAAEAEELRKLEWGALVVDEGHRLKNKEARVQSLGCQQAYMGGGCQRSELTHWEPVAYASSHQPAPSPPPR